MTIPSLPKPSRILRGPALAAIFLAGAFQPAVAQDEEEKPAPLPSQVEGVLQAMSAQLLEARTFTVHADILFDEVLDSGQLIQRAATLDIVGQRPGHLRAVFASDTEKRMFWLNGKTATIFDVDENVYATTNVPAGIGKAFDHLMDKYGISLPLADFFFPNPYEALTGSVQRASYIGTSPVNAVTCHHLAFMQETIDWQLWVAEGGQTLPSKIVIEYKEIPGSPRYMATLSGVDLQTPLAEATFKPTLPEDADSIDLLEIQPVTPQD